METQALKEKWKDKLITYARRQCVSPTSMGDIIRMFEDAIDEAVNKF